MRKHPALLCVDGNNIVHRSFHAYANQDIRDAQGRPAGAIYGLLVTLDKAIRQAEKIGVPPTHLLVAFDPRTYWRHDQYPAYKAGRSETDADLRDQLNRVGDVLTACGIPNACVERYEADDVLASVVTACAAAGGVSVVLSGDRDLLQLVSADALVLTPLNGGEFKVMNRAAVTEKYSVDPDRYLDLAALRGDKSDNLPGVSGIGPVKATALIDAFGSAAEALAAATSDPQAVDAAAGKGASAKMVAGTENLERNLKLMALCRDLDLDVGAYTPQADVAAAGLVEAGFGSMVDKLGAVMAAMTVRDAFRG
ncbi:MAG: hypothetical protein GY898_17950 [Proteobacteria bacterium]|nr:hypothetical protein [Pseudomonadota bacterium]